jgi:hypothetical protein
VVLVTPQGDGEVALMVLGVTEARPQGAAPQQYIVGLKAQGRGSRVNQQGALQDNMQKPHYLHSHGVTSCHEINDAGGNGTCHTAVSCCGQQQQQ